MEIRHPMTPRHPVQDCRREQLLQHNCNTILPHCDIHALISVCNGGNRAAKENSFCNTTATHYCDTLRHTATHICLDLRVQRGHRAAEENNFCNTTATHYCVTLQHTYALISVCNGGTGQPMRTTYATQLQHTTASHCNTHMPLSPCATGAQGSR